MALLTSIVSYWKCDESSGNLTDSVASNTLTNNNSATFGAGIINNGAYLESGSSQTFSIADGSQSGLDLSTDFTINFWQNLESQPGTDTSMVWLGKRGGGNGYTLKYEDASSVKRIGVNIQGTFVTVNQTLSDATWYMMTFVYTKAAGTCEVYLDGSSIGTLSSLATDLAGSTASFVVGDENGSRYFDGIFDEIGIWARVLTSGEVTSLYNSGAGLQYPFGESITNSNFLMLM